MFWNFAYHFRMLPNVINNLIPTGIMKQLVEQYYTKKCEYSRFEEHQKVLSVDDLLFGFKIWLGSCLVSFLAFVGEHIYSWYKAPKKVRFEKIEPLEINLTEVDVVLSTGLISKFRVKSNNDTPVVINLNESEITVDVHQSLDSEHADTNITHWNIFD